MAAFAKARENGVVEGGSCAVCNREAIEFEGFVSGGRHFWGVIISEQPCSMALYTYYVCLGTRAFAIGSSRIMILPEMLQRVVISDYIIIIDHDHD